MALPKPEPLLSAPSSPKEELSAVLDSDDVIVSESSFECVLMLDSSEPVHQHTELAASGSSTTDPIGTERPSTSSGSSGRRRVLNSEEIRAQWSLMKIFTTLGNHEQCIEFAEQRGLLPTVKMCTYHKKPMHTEKHTGQVGRFRCRKGRCREKSYSRSKGTWFEGAKLPLPLIFQVMYMYSAGYPYEAVQRETCHWREAVLSPSTIAEWFSCCREAMIEYTIENEEEQEKIGGPEKVVKIDETKFGQKKFTRGRNVDGLWVLGMVEDGSNDLRVEVFQDNQGSAESLIHLIKKHVQEGTTIKTDCWTAFDCLAENGYIHIKVNRSDKFEAPNEVHTPQIEGQWRVIKHLYSKENNNENFADWLIESMWRRRNRIHHRDNFEELIKCILYTHKV